MCENGKEIAIVPRCLARCKYGHRNRITGYCPRKYEVLFNNFARHEENEQENKKNEENEENEAANEQENNDVESEESIDDEDSEDDEDDEESIDDEDSEDDDSAEDILDTGDNYSDLDRKAQHELKKLKETWAVQHLVRLNRIAAAEKELATREETTAHARKKIKSTHI